MWRETVEGGNELGYSSLGSDIDRLELHWLSDGRSSCRASTSRIDSLLQLPCCQSLELPPTRLCWGGLVIQTRADRGHGWLRQRRLTLSTSFDRSEADMIRAVIFKARRLRSR